MFARGETRHGLCDDDLRLPVEIRRFLFAVAATEIVHAETSCEREMTRSLLL